VAAFPTPVVPKTLTMPANDGYRLNNVQRGTPGSQSPVRAGSELRLVPFRK